MGSLALNQVRRLDGTLVLVVSGIVDDATVESFEQGLDRATDAPSRQTIVDLTACRLDSAGLAALVRLRRRSNGHSAKTRLVVPDVETFWMLQITGLTSQFPTYPTMDEALCLPSAASLRVFRVRPTRRGGPRGGVEVWPPPHAAARRAGTQRRSPAPLRQTFEASELDRERL
jgi:anti-anti-sigma factor